MEAGVNINKEQGSEESKASNVVKTFKQNVGQSLSSVPIKTIVVANLVTLTTIVLAILVWKLRSLVVLFLLSVFITLVLEPLVSQLAKRGLKRSIAVTVVFFSIAILLVALAFALLTPAYESVNHLIGHLPKIVAQAEKGKGPVGNLVKKFHLENYIKENDKKLKNLVTGLGKPAISLGKSVLTGLIGVATLAVMTFFLMLEGPLFVSGLLKMASPSRERYLRNLFQKILKTVSGYMIGRFFIALVAFTVVFTSLLILGVPYPLALAVWVGLVDFLPIVGGLLAGIPTVFLAFLHSISAGIIFTVIFLAYLQIENHVLNTVVLSKTVRLNPFWVLLSVLLGADIGLLVAHEPGAVAFAIMAIPAAGVIQILVGELLNLSESEASAQNAGASFSENQDS